MLMDISSLQAVTAGLVGGCIGSLFNAMLSVAAAEKAEKWRQHAEDRSRREKLIQQVAIRFSKVYERVSEFIVNFENYIEAISPEAKEKIGHKIDPSIISDIQEIHALHQLLRLYRFERSAERMQKFREAHTAAITPSPNVSISAYSTIVKQMDTAYVLVFDELQQTLDVPKR